MFRKKDDDPAQPLPARGATPASSAPPAGKSPPPTTRAASATEQVGKRLIVGQGLSLSGDITSCDLLVVEGNVQVTLNDTRAIEIAESGRFTNGKASVEDAVISGVYEGELTVGGRLLVRGTGRVDGSIRYGELEVERGGRLTGSIAMLDGPKAAPATPKPAEAPKVDSPTGS